MAPCCLVGIIPINGFSIVHYAGVVTYNAKDFLKKNADFSNPDTVALFKNSEVLVLCSSAPGYVLGSRLLKGRILLAQRCGSA